MSLFAVEAVVERRETTGQLSGDHGRGHNSVDHNLGVPRRPIWLVQQTISNDKIFWNLESLDIDMINQFFLKTIVLFVSGWSSAFSRYKEGIS